MGLAVSDCGGYHGYMLNTIIHGEPTDKPPLLIAHGLYGSARNWGVIARRLSDERQVVAVDMRNHANSMWTHDHGYSDLANDLAEVIDQFGGQADVVGHSMGGKASMTLALLHSAKLRKLVVADIAPVAYSHSQIQFIEAMRAVDLSRVERRSDAEQQLADNGVEKALQSFFTQSLDINGQRWLLNLDTLASEMPKIMGFPEIDASWGGQTLFLSGGESDYVLPEHRSVIRGMFPSARFAKIPGAGHWLHAEKPREFEAAVRTFLNA
ncbi:Pimeloyl-ACP methyl ester carboxylesterase [Ruegeria faecimaris]|uniref:Pimeloyl-ACP methyl ester carboxylesterase n=2 Tax=Ruegeria faecimaris TaxID=686389 RepID=A0A521E116_9RHOB|nr:Pimeloyl-ACP methyl ester carboxylesterase [Ruegeria faecimaris]